MFANDFFKLLGGYDKALEVFKNRPKDAVAYSVEDDHYYYAHPETFVWCYKEGDEYIPKMLSKASIGLDFLELIFNEVHKIFRVGTHVTVDIKDCNGVYTILEEVYGNYRIMVDNVSYWVHRESIRTANSLELKTGKRQEVRDEFEPG